MNKPKFTKGEWRIVSDAQGPCMVMHPKLRTAIASCTNTHIPTNGYHNPTDDEPVNIAGFDSYRSERVANVLLIGAAPNLYRALARLIDELPTKRNWLDPMLEAEAREAIAQVSGVQKT